MTIIISAIRSRSLFQDDDNDGVPDPGDVFLHSIIVHNIGDEAATNVTVTETENGLTIDPGSVRIGPIAADDAFDNVGGNTPFAFTAAQLLGNDLDPDGGVSPALTITEIAGVAIDDNPSGPIAVTGGTLTHDGAGNFTFTPDTGFTGAAGFTYEITDAQGLTSVAATPGAVTINVTELFWYVDSLNGDDVTGDGSYLNPFASLAPLSTGGSADALDGAGDTIFVYERGTTNVGTIVLETGQKLYGDSVALEVNGLQVGASSGNSTIGASSGTIVTLGTNNVIEGINLVGSSSAAGLSGSNFGTLAISNASISTATGQILGLSTGSISAADGVSFGSLSSSGTVNGTAIAIDNVDGGAFSAGTVSIAGTTGATGDGVRISGGSSSTFGFGATTIGATGDEGIELSGANGAVTFASVTMNGAAGNGLLIDSATNAVAINGGAIGATDDPAGDAVLILGGSGAVTIAASLTKTSAGQLVEIANHSGGTISFTGNLSNTGSGQGMVLDANSGSIGFSGTTKVLNAGANNAVTITNNNAAISFTGGNLDIDTTAGIGIVATGTGGSLAIDGSNNTITATSGRAIVLDGPDSAGITLQSVNVGGGGAGTAVYLNNAGNGGFTVTGTGSTAGSGGTIGTVNGTTGQTNTGIGVYIGNTDNVSLSNMTFNGTKANYAIRGDNVTNFTLRDSTITGTNGDNAGADEGAVAFNNLDGVGLFEGNSISGGHEDNLWIVNTENSTLNLFVRDSANDQAVFGLNGTANGNDSIRVETQNDANLFMLVDGVEFTGWRGDAVNTTALGTSNHEVTVRNSTFFNTHSNIVSAGGIGVLIGGTAGGGTWGVDYTIQDNQFTGADGYALAASFNGYGGTARGFISGNTIGTSGGGYDGSGSANAGGIFASVERSGVGSGELLQYVTIQNNQIRDVRQVGIFVRATNGESLANNARIEATVNNNLVTEMGGTSSFSAFRGLAGGNDPDFGQVGLDMNGNTFDISGTTDAYAPVFFDQIFGTASRYYFPGYVGTDGPNFTDIQNYLSGRSNTLINDDAPLTGNTGQNVYAPDAVMDPGTLQPAQTGSNTQLPSGAMFAGAPPQAPTGGGEGGTGVPPGASDPAGEGDGSAPPEPPHPVIVDDGVLTQAELVYLVDAAIQRWIEVGATAEQVAAMRAASFSVVPMSGLYLGASQAGSIRIDSDGAGHGWFLDTTPLENEEFGGSGTRLTADAGGPAAGRMDLLTVLMHELGHQIGLDDDYNLNGANSLMYGNAHLGDRRLPQSNDLAGADLTHAGHEAFVLTVPTIATLPAGKSVQITYTSTVNGFSNQLIPSFENYTTVEYDTLIVPVESAPEALDIDTLTLGGTIWLDDGAGGGVGGNGLIDGGETGVAAVTVSLFADVNNDDIADDPSTPIATDVTDAGGNYSFAGLAPGNYIVQVDAANFSGAGALLGKASTSGANDPDDNVDNDDNGAPDAGGVVASRAISLSYNSETEDDGTGQLDINGTLDFGFLVANQAPTLGNLDGDAIIFTEDGPPVMIDAGSDATVADSDSADFDGGSLTVSIVAGGVPAEDVLGLDTSGTIGLAGGVVSVGGADIGTLTGGTGGNDLVIAFNASATAARVQELVRALTYANTNALNPNTSARSIAISLVDGDGTADGGMDTVMVTVGASIIPVDDPAVAQDDALTTTEDQIATGNLFVNNGSGGDTDPDGPALQITAVNGSGANVGTTITLASGARLTVQANGSYSYDPNGKFDYLAPPGAGASNSPAFDSFTYMLANGNTATVTVTINGVDSWDGLFGTAGADTMSGGIGRDRLYGRDGNDTLFGNRDSDRLFGEDGDDQLDGGSGHDELYGGPGNDTLLGGQHNDRLDGGSGSDLMIGGTGHDTYVVDNAGDRVIEGGFGGTDTVESSISYTLPSNVERLFLTGPFSLSGRGNNDDNRIVGNSGSNFLNGGGGDDSVEGGAGNDILYGMLGNDKLIGGPGKDWYVFNTAPGPGNVDQIVGFSTNWDAIYLARYAYAAVGSRGELRESAFHLGASAVDSDDRILYDQASGSLFYDPDGIGSAAAILFATVAPGTIITYADFVVYD